MIVKESTVYAYNQICTDTLEECLSTRHYCINWVNFIFLIKSTTGWFISLITIPTAPYSVKNCSHYLTSPPVLFRGQPWTSRVCRHRWRPRRRCAGKVNVKVHWRHVHHHPGQQRDDAASGAHQRAEMGCAKQPQAELQQVDRGHLQRPQAKATPCCGRRVLPTPLLYFSQFFCKVGKQYACEFIDQSVTNLLTYFIYTALRWVIL